MPHFCSLRTIVGYDGIEGMANLVSDFGRFILGRGLAFASIHHGQLIRRDCVCIPASICEIISLHIVLRGSSRVLRSWSFHGLAGALPPIEPNRDSRPLRSLDKTRWCSVKHVDEQKEKNCAANDRFPQQVPLRGQHFALAH